MIKINLSNAVLDLSGVSIPDMTLGKLVGNQLAASNKGDALKYYDWALSLYKGEDILVDKSDFKRIKEFVENSEQLTNLVKAQTIKVLDEAEKAEEITN